MRKKRVVLVDDHQLVLDAVSAAISEDAEFEVVATATSGHELAPLLAQTDPDVVLLDLSMPGPDGLACVDVVRKERSRTKVIVLSGADEPRVARQALARGADAFVRKNVDPRDLVAVIRQTVEQTVYVQPPAAPEPATLDERGLTRAELAVFGALAEGLLNKQIAAKLCVTQQTVKFHLTNVYRKLGVDNRTQAVRWAFDRGLTEHAVSAV